MKDFLLGLDLEDGQHRVVCPVCSGGTSRERSLALQCDGTSVRWLCHRASCQNRGQSGRTGIESSTSYTHKSSKNPLGFQHHHLPHEAQTQSHKQQHSDLMKPSVPQHNPPQGYLPRLVVDNQGVLRGIVYRRTAVLPKHYPKDINRIDPHWCKLHFPSPMDCSIVLLVEDIISAEKMNPYFPCVSLLGVHLSEDKVDYLLTQGITSVIIALDNDATLQAIRLARKFAIASYILPLQRDFKDETDERLEEIAGVLHARYNNV